MTELKPCPFCGSILVAHTLMPYIGLDGHGYVVECDRCWAKTGYYSTKEEAFEAWNTRHVETCKVELLDEIVRCRDCDFAVFDGKTCIRVDPWFEEYWFEVEPDGFCAWGKKVDEHMAELGWVRADLTCAYVIEGELDDATFRCTNCGERYDYLVDRWLMRMPHCPNCGAKVVER